MVVRVQAQDESWVWLYMVLQLQPGEIPISSNNHIIRYFSALRKRKSSLVQREAVITVAFSFFLFPPPPAVNLRPGRCVSS